LPRFGSNPSVHVANLTSTTELKFQEERFPKIAELNNRRKRLLYRCKQRGWLELDLLMGSWVDQNVSRLNHAELDELELIAKQENPDLMKWLLNQEPLPAQLQTPLMKQLQAYVYANSQGWIAGTKKGNQ